MTIFLFRFSYNISYHQTEYKGWGSIAKDAQGNKAVKSVDEDGDPDDCYTIRNLYEALENGIRNPFWIDQLKGYDFGNFKVTRLCARPTRYASTFADLGAKLDCVNNPESYVMFHWPLTCIKIRPDGMKSMLRGMSQSFRKKLKPVSRKSLVVLHSKIVRA